MLSIRDFVYGVPIFVIAAGAAGCSREHPRALAEGTSGAAALGGNSGLESTGGAGGTGLESTGGASATGGESATSLEPSGGASNNGGAGSLGGSLATGGTWEHSGGAAGDGGVGSVGGGSNSNRSLALQWGAPVALTRLTQLVAAPSGEVFFTGWTQGAIAPTGLHGATDALIAKINADRSIAWVRQLGQEGGAFTGIEVKAWDAALTGEGDLVIAGLVNGRGTFRGELLTTTFTAFVAKVSGSGDELWIRLVGGSDGATELMGVEVLADQHIVVAGATSSSLLGDQPGQGGQDVFLAWYTPEGELQRVRRYGTDDEDYPTAFVSTESNLFFTRQVISRQTGASTRIDLTRTDLTGDAERSIQFDAPERTLVGGLAKTAEGLCAALSIRTSSVEAGTGADYELRCYSNELLQLSSTRRGTPGATALAGAVACQPSGECAIGGLVDTEFEGEGVEANNDAFVATFNQRSLRASRHFGPRPVSDRSHGHVGAAVYAADGSLIVGGEVGGDFFVPQVGPVDLFVMALDPVTLMDL